jgi:ABC-type nitrate/sulfonate/bicarbonate transport system substrate-binding protein
MNPGQGYYPIQRAVALCAVLAVLPLLACTGTRAPAAAPPAQAAPAAPGVHAAAAASPTTEATPVHVTGGLLPSIAGAPILVGVDLGIYERNGLDASIETFTSTPQIMTAIAAASSTSAG